MAVSDDWAVGDLAVCVNVDPHPWSTAELRALRPNEVYRVSGLRADASILGLYLAEVPCLWAFDAERFRKIRPDAREGNADDWREITKLHTRKVRA